MRSIFESEKDGLRRELQQALAKKETGKHADEDITRLQKEVKYGTGTTMGCKANHGVPSQC